MANLSYKSASLAGTDPAPVSAGASGDVVPALSTGFLQVTNGSASSVTVTLVTPGKSRFGIVDEPDLTIAVPAGATRLIGPLVDSLIDPASGGVKFTYSATTSVTVAAIRG